MEADLLPNHWSTRYIMVWRLRQTPNSTINKLHQLTNRHWRKTTNFRKLTRSSYLQHHQVSVFPWYGAFLFYVSFYVFVLYLYFWSSVCNWHLCSSASTLKNTSRILISFIATIIIIIIISGSSSSSIKNVIKLHKQCYGVCKKDQFYFWCHSFSRPSLMTCVVSRFHNCLLFADHIRIFREKSPHMTVFFTTVYYYCYSWGTSNFMTLKVNRTRVIFFSSKTNLPGFVHKSTYSSHCLHQRPGTA